jgi:hypothetical protein
MATSDERLEKLKVATELCMFEKGQQSSAKSSLWWGVICIGIGLIVLRVGSELGAAINLGFGVLLIATGLYQVKVRAPRAVQVSAAMLALLALWNLGGLALAIAFKGRFLGGGHGVIAGLAQAFGAFSTWQAHALYKALQEKVDPSTLVEVQPYLASLEESNLGEMLEFKRKPNLENEQIWRVQFIDDLALVGCREAANVTKKYNLKDAVWVRRSDLRVEQTGETWIGHDIKAVVHLGPVVKIDKVVMSPGVFERLSGMKASA